MVAPVRATDASSQDEPGIEPKVRLDDDVKALDYGQVEDGQLNESVARVALNNSDDEITGRPPIFQKGLPTKSSSGSKKKDPHNELTKLIPGYTAPLKLDSSSLDPYRVGIAEFRRRAERTDRSTAAFVVGATTSAHCNAMRRTPACTTAVGFVPSSAVAAYSSFKTGTKRPTDTTAGSRWFGMEPTPMTDELKTDMAVIRNRNYLDPKRFYKSADKIEGKVLQVGTVIEGPTEYISSRLSKKQRRSNLAEEIMADPASADYAKNKFKAMQQAKAESVRKWQRKGKKRQRGH